MNNIKRALDIFEIELNNLKEDVSDLKQDINNIQEGFKNIYKILSNFKEKIDFLDEIKQEQTSTHKSYFPAEIKGSSTHQYPFKPLNNQNIGISIGNKGASTDRQTDRQTDNQTQKKLNTQEIQEKNTIDSAAEIIDSLDNIKKQIRLKFKRLTDQEMLVFSTIYQFDEEKGFSNYKMLAERLNLTESSIRDYVGRLLKKQAPIDKIRTNNKEIELRISRNLKKITSLNTILKLREL